MFCFQCEQAAHCTACTGKAGVCGKTRGHGRRRRTALTGALIVLRQPAASAELGEPIRPPEQALLLIGRAVHHHHQRELRPDSPPADGPGLTEKHLPCRSCPGIGVRLRHGKQLWHEPDEDIRSLKSFGPVQPARHGSVQLPCAGAGPHRTRELDRFFCDSHLQAVGSEHAPSTPCWQLVQKTGLMASYRLHGAAGRR